MKKKKYDNLKEIYPEFVSLEQFHQICKIAKRSAKYLIENKLIPVIDSGKKTWRYSIALDDVIIYLRRREQWGSMIPLGALSSRKKSHKIKRLCFDDFLKLSDEHEIKKYFSYIYTDFPDMLMTSDIVEMTGLGISSITKMLKSEIIKSIKTSTIYLVPKSYLLEFVVTPQYINSKCNSEQFKKIVGGFRIWKNAKL